MPPPCAISGLPPPFPPWRSTSCFSSACVDPDVGRAGHDDRGGRRITQEDGDVAGTLDDARVAMSFNPAASQPGSDAATRRASPPGRRRPRARRLLGRELRLKVLDLLAQLLAVRLEALDRRRQLRGKHGERADAARDGVAQGAESRQGAAAAEKRDAGSAAESLGRGDGDDPDRAGARHVSAAARREIEVLDVDQAQRSFPLRLLSQRQRRDLVRCREEDRDRPILPDDPIGLGFGARALRADTSRARSIVE